MERITKFGDNLLLKVPFVGNNYSLLMAMTGFKKFKDGTRDLIFRPTANNIRYIQQHWPDVVWEGAAKDFLDNFIREQAEAQEALNNKQAQVINDADYNYKTNPFDHQRKIFSLSREFKRYAIFAEQGTGKTKVAIDTAAYLFAHGKIDCLIVIAPNGVHSNWIESEIPIHLPDWVPREMWAYSSKVTKKNAEAFETVLNNKEVLRIFAFNIEGFVSEKAREAIQTIMINANPMVIIDESQYIKNHSAKRTKYLTKLCRDVPYKRILTGTSVTKGIEDLYGQFSWLDQSILGYDSFYTFKANYCTMGGYEMKQIVGYKNIDELVQLITPFSYRVTKKDCLDLPEKIYKRWVVELTKQQREIYNKLKNDFYVDVNERRITATLAIVRLLRLQQITCGWFPDEVLTPIAGGNPKLDAVLQHCKDTEGKVIVWCGGAGNTADIKNITVELQREHGRDMVEPYYGEVSADDRMDILRNFQEGDLKYIVANGSMARGVTATACENPIYFSNSYDLEFRLQSEDRTHRIGTKNNVTYTDVEAKGTYDRRIITALRNKKSIADIINQDPKQLFMESHDG